MEDAGYAIGSQFSLPTATDALNETVQDILLSLESLRAGGRMDRLTVFYVSGICPVIAEAV
jgi:hypothetical protein